MPTTENPNAPTIVGSTPIFWAVCEGHLEMVKLLVTVTDNPNLPRNDGWSPALHVAKVLISATKFLNVPDNAGDTPHNIALERNNYNIAALFPRGLKWWCLMGISLLQPYVISFLAECRI